MEKVQSDVTGRLLFNLKGGGSDVGIFLQDDPGFISMANYKMDEKLPQAWQKITLIPILFNKGGSIVDSIKVDLISQDEDLEVLTRAKW